jgi:ComF family protein
MVPVPLHPHRLRKRGFNQALVLARILSRTYNIPLDRDNLVRTRWTQSQVGLSERERKDNVRGAFAVLKSARITQRTILLLDDIYTSGSTVDECSKVLINAGARKVDILTLARAA